MADAKHPVLRVVIPLALVLGLGTIIAFSVARNTTGRAPTPPTAPSPSATPPTAPAQPPAAQPGAGEQPAPSPTEPVPAQPAAPDQSGGQPMPAPTTPAGAAARPSSPARTLSAQTFPNDPAAAGPFTPIGSSEPSASNPYEMEIRFRPLGAGVDTILLRTVQSIDPGSPHDLVQQAFDGGTPEDPWAVVPFAALSLRVGDQYVNLAPRNEQVWRELAPGQFEAFVVDDAGSRVIRLTRTYRLEPGRFDLTLDQHAENLTDEPLTITWYQYGPVSLPRGKITYGGDTRRVRFGYLLSAQNDPQQDYVESATRYMLPHQSAIGGAAERVLWPTEDTIKRGLSLVWTATTNRYFAAAMFPAANTATPPAPPTAPIAPPAPGSAPAPAGGKAFTLVKELHRFTLPLGKDASGKEDTALVLRVTSPEVKLAARGSVDLSHGVYSGPISNRIITGQAQLERLGLQRLELYTFGGPCGFCTFQWLTSLLHGFLSVLHDYVFHDWSLAIITLVFCVRLLLHPITKRAQSSLQRFGKQMQALAPKQKAIQEKYKNEPQKMREELARLMREENVNYAGCLGILPMFLQTPIWIALFAMLFFTYELRHQPAFYGVFQALSGGRWPFLGDLAEPDRFIPFAQSIHVPLLSGLMGPIGSINVLPILLGIVFFIQQKYLTPTTATALTPEQQQQQKIMKVMMVVMFPLFMYNMPSGLTLYTITNSVLGIIESKRIRKHVEEEDARRAAMGVVRGGGGGGDAAGGFTARRGPKPGKPGGFMDRLREQLELAQKMREQKLKEQARQRGKPKR